MADRNANLTITGIANLDAARAAFEKLFKEIEAREIKLNVAGGTGTTPGRVTNPATFGNQGGGAVTGITSAAQRLDAVSMARNTGPALVMSNGQPGAPAGGLVNAAAQRLEAVSTATAAVRNVTPGVVASQAVAGALTNRHGIPSIHLGTPNAPMSPAPMTTAEHAALAASEGQANAAFRQRVMSGIASDASSIVAQREMAAGAASPVTLPIGTTRGGASRPGSRGMPSIGGALALGGATYLTAEAMQGVAGYFDAQMPSGSMFSAATRQEMARVDSLSQIPLAGSLARGAFDLVSQRANANAGRGRFSDMALMRRQADQEDARGGMMRREIADDYDRMKFRTGSTRLQIGIDEEAAYRTLDDVEMMENAAFRDPTTGNINAFGMRYRAGRASEIQMAGRRARRDFNSSLADADNSNLGAASSLASSLSGDVVGELSERAFGNWARLSNNPNFDPETLSRARTAGGISYITGLGQIGIENRSSAIDMGVSTTAMSLRRTGRGLQAGITEIEGQRERLLRDVKSSGDADLDMQFGITQRRDAINAQADEQLRVARQDDADNRRMIAMGQDFSGRSLDRALARDQVGANGWSIAGGTLSRVADLQRTYGIGSEEEQRERALGVKSIQFAQQNYGDAFRAQSFDAWNTVLSPRDSEDPGKVFGELSKAMESARSEEALGAREPGPDKPPLAPEDLEKFKTWLGDLLGPLTGKSP